MADTATIFMNQLLNIMLNKVIVPLDYHSQVGAIEEMLRDDNTGMIDSLTDFSVSSAAVNFEIETDNSNLTQLLNKWLETINIDYNGLVPSGVKALSKEYYKELWKKSSFPILKIADWGTVGTFKVPTKLFFVDGGSVYAHEKDNSNKYKKLVNYDYYLGSEKIIENKLSKGVIFNRPYGSWYDKYPTPFLIKRGVYHNYYIIKLLKDNQSDVLERIVPYLLQILKGSDALTSSGKRYNDEDFKGIKNDIKTMLDKMNDITTNKKTPIRISNYDEQIKHLIPDISALFKRDLFSTVEKHLLAGLGFIDVVEGVSTSRRSSILNPKVFIEEVKNGVDNFKNILNHLIHLIIQANSTNIKYINSNIKIKNSSVTAFMTDEFKNQMRLLWERGQVSNKTYCEVVGERMYEEEKKRREDELKNGDEEIMYPHFTQNQEQHTSYEEENRKDTDKNGKPIPTDKTDDPEKYNIGKLETAPYTRDKLLPKAVRKLSTEKQNKWRKVFNKSYLFYLKKYNNTKKAETMAFRTAWKSIKS